jgi:cell division septum initiation protein DivIVA
MTDPIQAAMKLLQDEVVTLATEKRRLKQELHEARLQCAGARRSLESMRDEMQKQSAEAGRIAAGAQYEPQAYHEGCRAALRTQAAVAERMLNEPEFRRIET